MTKPLHPFFSIVSQNASLGKETSEKDNESDDYNMKLSELAESTENEDNSNRMRKKKRVDSNLRPQNRRENTVFGAKPRLTTTKLTTQLPALVQSTGDNDSNRGRSDTFCTINSENLKLQNTPSNTKPKISVSSTLPRKGNRQVEKIVTKGIVHQIWSRATNPRNQTQHIKAIKMPSWSACPWLRLPTPNAGCVACMAFDIEGVLLAAAIIDRHILIWDWDTVVASDFQGRRDGQVDSLNPVLKIRVPHLVSNMEWSPNDCLLTSFRDAPQLHIYDMGLISENKGRSIATYCTTLQPPRLVRSSQGPKCTSFLPGHEHIVACYPCGYVCCWNVASKRLIWTWKSNEIVSCIHVITGTNLILLGGIHGGFAMIDWQRTTRKTFSSEMTPKILNVWRTGAWFVSNQYSVQDCHLGVEAIVLDTPLLPNNAIKSMSQIGACKLTWITSGGWMLRTNLKDTRRLNIEILQQPPYLKTLTAEGNFVAEQRFSTPANAVLSTSSIDSLLMLQVPQTTHILPHHDKRVCQPRQIITERSIRLGFISRYDPEMQQIVLRRTPSALCLHPTQSWMITAYKNRLGIWSARAPQTTSKS